MHMDMGMHKHVKPLDYNGHALSQTSVLRENDRHAQTLLPRKPISPTRIHLRTQRSGQHGTAPFTNTTPASPPAPASSDLDSTRTISPV